MSEISVNDHLEGILSDFEALKRSFDIDDVNDIPTFSHTSSVTYPISPGAILNKTNDVRNPGNQVSPPYCSRINISCSPAQSPVMRNRMVSSLSFNRGTMGKPTINANTGINRAASFQNKFNPNGFITSSGPGSDNESLHSSSSSLEYQASSKVCSYTSPPQSPIGVEEYKAQCLGSPALNKFSSHGNMFHSELEGPIVVPTDPIDMNHSSMPSLDLQMAETPGMRRVVSPGSRLTSAGAQWNTSPHHIQNSSPFARDISLNQQSPKPKEPVRLNKFPLDLESLVFKSEEESLAAPKPPPRFHPLTNSPTMSASPSASISSLDSTDIPMALSNNIEKREPFTPSGAIPVPNISESPALLSPAQTPQFNIVCKPQVVQVAPASPPLSGQMENNRKINQNEIHAKESVGSILQRISSFSRVDTKASVSDPNPVIPLSNGVKKDSPPIQRKELKRSEDTTQEQGLDLEPSVRMEEEKEVMEEREMEIEHPPPCLNEPDTQGIIKGKDLFGYVGIEAVLDQMRRRTMKAAFEFNIMVVGQSGLGKSTLVNTLFKSKVSRKSCTPNYEEKISKTVHLQSVSHIIEEKGVKMKLTVIDTPGFGDQINNENCWEPIVKYVDEQYEKYLKEELNINRKRRIPDTRVHCCVYFLPATGHWLRPIDVEFMRRLGKIVSIVPVIAKADTLTLEERLEFKQRIRQDLQANGIRVYPQREYDEDAEDRILNDKIRENIPFAVVGTDKEHQVNGNKVLGRKTKWGIIEVENVAHCEFALLRDLLIRRKYYTSGMA
ncbi:septin-9 isoform X3 [Myxocyprinus asiaticus]|uniref:septin-9 isoform X3 n=1 Tax=Myxocyprinus asiaticus TaxID=70543 RepID=UPI0022232081|nr:septin-9 isoform X3 [Myxocyprinus asiaticus]